MLNIQKEALKKGYWISGLLLYDNKVISNSGAPIGRIYQDNYICENRINMDFKNTQKILKVIYDLEITEQEYVNIKHDNIYVYKVDYMLFGGAVWSLLN